MVFAVLLFFGQWFGHLDYALVQKFCLWFTLNRQLELKGRKGDLPSFWRYVSQVLLDFSLMGSSSETSVDALCLGIIHAGKEVIRTSASEGEWHRVITFCCFSWVHFCPFTLGALVSFLNRAERPEAHIWTSPCHKLLQKCSHCSHQLEVISERVEFSLPCRQHIVLKNGAIVYQLVTLYNARRINTAKCT